MPTTVGTDAILENQTGPSTFPESHALDLFKILYEPRDIASYTELRLDEMVIWIDSRRSWSEILNEKSITVNETMEI